MYGWLWNHTPGRVWLRLLIWTMVVLALVAVLFLWVFPWVEPRLPFTDVTVDDTSSS
jgi:hypothetical protein